MSHARCASVPEVDVPKVVAEVFGERLLGDALTILQHESQQQEESSAHVLALYAALRSYEVSVADLIGAQR